jgi:hypothetical protein
MKRLLIAGTAGPIYDAINPDLRQFVNHGGKLLAYHAAGATLAEGQAAAQAPAPSARHCCGAQGSPRRRAVLSQVTQAERPCPTPPHHRSPRELPCRVPGDHAVRHPQHNTTRNAKSGPKSPTSRGADARATCGVSNRRHPHSGSSQSMTSCATCSPLGDIGFGPAISDFCVAGVHHVERWSGRLTVRRRDTRNACCGRC